jgi:Flp pilus assembly protein CpaB
LSRRVRVGILVAIVGIALAAAGIWVLSNIVQQSLAPRPAPTPLPPATESVVMTTHAVALGTVLDTRDLKLVEVPVELAPPGTLNNIEAAVGRFSKVDLASGEVLLDHHLADPTNVSHDVAFILEDDQVLLAFPANDLMSSLSVIQRGDQVDIFVTLSQEVRIVREGPDGVLVAQGGEQETETVELTFDAMQRVEITALVADIVYEEQPQQAPSVPLGGEGEPQPQPTPKPAEITVKAYLLALSPQDALVLKHLKDIGAEFDFVLRSPTSTEIFDLTPINSDYLMDRYELEIPKPR